VSVTTIAMRPASDPAVELRVQRREREHAVLEQHLVEGLHVELRPERVFRAPAHLRPLESAERVCEHEARKAADQRDRLHRALRRAERHRFLQVRDRPIRGPALHLHAEVRDHHRRD
jgi:hypothetical protein